jgi:hypothetical protein
MKGKNRRRESVIIANRRVSSVQNRKTRKIDKYNAETELDKGGG